MTFLAGFLAVGCFWVFFLSNFMVSMLEEKKDSVLLTLWYDAHVFAHISV